MADPASPLSAIELDGLLRRCVQCGLCLPHCATWQATGNEVHSPRGRLVLLADLIDGSVPGAAADYAEAFDHCIGCRACETACPSGVPYSLLAAGMVAVQGKGQAEPALPDWLLRRLDSRSWLRLLGTAGRGARAAARLLFGEGWRRSARTGVAAGAARLLGTLPTAPRRDADLLDLLDGLCGRAGSSPGRAPVPGAAPARTVAFFTGCASGGLLPGTSRRLQNLLAAAGCRVVEPGGQVCCGALAEHTGRPGRAAHLARSNREAFAGMGPDSLLVVEAAGCGATLKELQPGPGPTVVDAVELLSGLDLPALGTVPLRVALHDPCHARHGQGLVAEPRRLLAMVPGLTVVEPDEPEVCCGSGGAWSLEHPALSEAIGRRKAGLLRATGADLVVTANPGCLGQLADALASTGGEGEAVPPVLPLTDLIWYAAAVAEG